MLLLKNNNLICTLSNRFLTLEGSPTKNIAVLPGHQQPSASCLRSSAESTRSLMYRITFHKQGMRETRLVKHLLLL